MALEKQKLTGYELMNWIGERMHKKPSAGSMYPLLKELTEKKFIQFEENGRKKIYSLTNTGKRKITMLLKEKEKMINQKKEFLSWMSDIHKEKDCIELEKLEDFIERNLDVFVKFKNASVNAMIKNNSKNTERKIRDILSNATKEIKNIK